jgi:hypothetical protein
MKVKPSKILNLELRKKKRLNIADLGYKLNYYQFNIVIVFI